ncbi:hypothetical protein KY326_03615 [Candidatus Woesearchaeota archaeon]|nr:hypothetical protein [Candidatus Woesearchaeota archaeon]
MKRRKHKELVDEMIDTEVKFSHFFKLLGRKIKLWFIYHKCGAALLLAFIFTIIFLIIINTVITVPYTAVDVVEEEIMTVDVEYIYEDIPYEVVVPVQKQEEVTEIVSNRSKTNVTYEHCYDVDMKYNISYHGDLSEMKDKYDSLHTVGYWEGTYYQTPIVCNEEEDYELQLVYKHCKMQGNDTVDCHGGIMIEVLPQRCLTLASIPWETIFSPDKDIVLIPESVSQKKVCEERQREVEIGKRNLVEVTTTKNKTEYVPGVEYKEVRREKPVVENRTKISTKETIKYRGIITDFLARLFE